MGEVDVEVVDHYWSRVELLAIEAESGEYVASDLARVVEEAIDAFAATSNARAQLEALISDLQVTADAYREQRPSYAAIFSRAALIAMNPSAELA